MLLLSDCLSQYWFWQNIWVYQQFTITPAAAGFFPPLPSLSVQMSFKGFHCTHPQTEGKAQSSSETSTWMGTGKWTQQSIIRALPRPGWKNLHLNTLSSSNCCPDLGVAAWLRCLHGALRVCLYQERLKEAREKHEQSGHFLHTESDRLFGCKQIYSLKTRATQMTLYSR